MSDLIDRAHAWIDNDNLPLTAELTKQLVARIRELEDAAELRRADIAALGQMVGKAEAERDATMTLALRLRGEGAAIEAATIERCAVLAQGAQWAGLDAETGEQIAAAIRALAKPTKPITDRTDPEGGIPGRT
jgi:hypothetical protein